MRQRLGIAAALLREPRLMLLDEPATGLDPAGMRDMRALIRRLADGGMTVVLSSHLLAEVEELCNRVAIVRSGAMVYEGAIVDLKRTSASGYRLRTTDDARAYEVCAAARGLVDVRRSGGAIHFGAGDEAAAELSVALVEGGVAIIELARETATLEDLFFKLTEGPGGELPAPVAA
jgi:ABC-2 type transport system ATP-binding protein